MAKYSSAMSLCGWMTGKALLLMASLPAPVVAQPLILSATRCAPLKLL